MATNYTGVPTATQAPGAKPGPGVLPILSLPQDGVDDLNVASVYQAFKELADYASWGMDPFPNSLDWSVRTWGVKNARGQRKWYLDHMGHPAGRINVLREDWAGADIQNGAGSTTFNYTRLRDWTAFVTEATGSGAMIQCQDVSFVGVPSTKLSNVLAFVLGTSVTDRNEIKSARRAIFSADNAMAVEWDFVLGATALTETDFVGGFCDSFPNPVFSGACFKSKRATNGNWWASTGDGASNTDVDTGSSIGSGAVTMRVEWWGANVADDSLSKCRFYINGGLAATIAATPPTTTHCREYFASKKSSGVAQNTSFIAPVSMTHNY